MNNKTKEKLIERIIELECIVDNVMHELNTIYDTVNEIAKLGDLRVADVFRTAVADIKYAIEKEV